MTAPGMCVCGHAEQVHVPGGGSCTSCPGCLSYEAARTGGWNPSDDELHAFAMNLDIPWPGRDLARLVLREREELASAARTAEGLEDMAKRDARVAIARAEQAEADRDEALSRCSEGMQAGLRQTYRGLELASRAAAAEAEVARLRAGADPAPVSENTQPTAAQLWHWLLEGGEYERLDYLASLLDLARQAHDCFLRNHEYVILAEQDTVRRLATAVARVRELHFVTASAAGAGATNCAGCSHDWPCPTIRAVAGAPPAETCRIGHELYGACELPYGHDGPHARVPGGATEANTWTDEEATCSSGKPCVACRRAALADSEPDEGPCAICGGAPLSCEAGDGTPCPYDPPEAGHFDRPPADPTSGGG